MAQQLSMQKIATLAVVFGIVFAAVTVLLLSLFKPGVSTGQAGNTGEIQAGVGEELGIEVVPPWDVINFGSMNRDTSKDTTPALPTNPKPFLIRNNGNVDADVEVCAMQNLWSGTSKVDTDYRFSITDAESRIPMDNCVTTPCFNMLNSKTTPTNMPYPCPTGIFAIDNLRWEDTNDEAIMHIYVHVPPDEPPGSKTSTVIVTGMSSLTYGGGPLVTKTCAEQFSTCYDPNPCPPAFFRVVASDCMNCCKSGG